MKLIGNVFVVLSCLFLTVVEAAETSDSSKRINSKESLSLCKSAIEADMDEGHEIKYRRKTATSVDMDAFKHWINATKIVAGDKTPVKVLCETSRTGDILNLQLEQGHWKF